MKQNVCMKSERWGRMTRKEFNLVVYAMACLAVGQPKPALRALDLLRMQYIDGRLKRKRKKPTLC